MPKLKAPKLPPLPKVPHIGANTSYFHWAFGLGLYIFLGGLSVSLASPEVTLIVSPPHEAEADMRRVDAALGKALEFMPLRAAVDLVAEMLEAPRRAVYERALAKKDDG